MNLSNRMLTFSKLYSSVNLFKTCKRNLSSALYITGDKAHETFSVLTPHIDFEDRLENKQYIENNIKIRGLNINLDETIRVWNFYQHIKSKRNDLEYSKVRISQTIKSLSQKSNKYNEEKIDTLKAHGKMVKDDLKTLKESLWSLEEQATIRVLSLPNFLHEKTPYSDLFIIHSYLEQPKLENPKYHMNVAENLDLLEYFSPDYYFLKNDAALFDLFVPMYLSDYLISKNYVQFSNSDFSRSVIVEGCGLNFSDLKTVFTINEHDVEHFHENSRLHLTGGATLTGFMAYYARHTVFTTQLPLKYFSIGKKYSPAKTNNKSLLNVTQENAVSIFIAAKDEQEMNNEFENLLKETIDFYEKLGYHFRVCFLPAYQLENWECLRASIQLFSPHLSDYVEVGCISLSGDFISKRLLLNYGKGADVNFPCIISGTLLSVPKLLACVLEEDTNNIHKFGNYLK